MSDELYLNVFICAAGLLLHIMMKWAEYRSSIQKLGLSKYLGEVPAQTAVAVIGSVAAFTVTHAMEWMNPGMALACGYMGNSVAENLTKKFMDGKP